jgi:release factor glutamine methyltransferase
VGLVEKLALEKNVLDFEPELALFSEDPNRFYFRIVQLFLEDATAQTLFFELNPQHVEEVQSEVLKHDLHWETRTDFRGKMRMAKIRKS